jgi:hypothetical protein
MADDVILIDYIIKSCNAASKSLDMHDQFIVTNDKNLKINRFYKVTIQPELWSIRQGAALAILRINISDLKKEYEINISATYINPNDVGPNRSGWNHITKKIISTFFDDEKIKW